MNNEWLEEYGLYIKDGEEYRELHYIKDNSLVWKPNNYEGDFAFGIDCFKGNHQLITGSSHSGDSCLTNSNDSLQTEGMAFTTGGSADPSLYVNKGKLH